MDPNAPPLRLHHNYYTTTGGFPQADLPNAFTYPAPTPDQHHPALPPNAQDHIHNDLNSTVFIPYTADWYTDFVTDVSHDLATQRVAVASAIPYQQFQQQQMGGGYGMGGAPGSGGEGFGPVTPHEVTVTTPAPIITIFEHIDDEWRVQNTLPASHLGNIYKIEWAEPEFGTLLASCSDDGLVHVYEEILVDKHTQSNLLASAQGAEALGNLGKNNLTPAQQIAQKKKAAARKPVAQTTTTQATTTSANTTAGQNTTTGANVGPNQTPTPATISTQTPSTITSLLNHVFTRPQPTTWIRKSTFNDGFDPVVFLQWAPRHMGCKLATCSLDGKLRIYDLLSTESHEIVVFDYDCTGCAWNRSPFDTPMILAVGGVYGQVFEFVEKVGGSASQQGPSQSGSKWYRQCILPTHVDTITTCAWAPTYGRTFHIVATGDRSGIVRIFKLFPRGYDGSGASGAACELLSLLVPYQFKHFHFKTHGSSSLDGNGGQGKGGSGQKKGNVGLGENIGNGIYSMPIDPFCPSNSLNGGRGNSPLPQLLSAAQIDQKMGATGNYGDGTTGGQGQDQQHAKSVLLYRGYNDQMVPTRQRFPRYGGNDMGGGPSNQHGVGVGDDVDDQFIIDSFLGIGFSISRLQFDPTGQLLSVVDDSGTTTVYSCRHDGFWAPFYSPPPPTTQAATPTTPNPATQSTTEDIIDQFNIPQDPHVDPYQYLRQQQMLKKEQKNQLLDKLVNGNR